MQLKARENQILKLNPSKCHRRVCGFRLRPFTDPLISGHWHLVADYEPSGDLLSALATLPGDLTYTEETVKSEHPEDYTRIKKEPLDPIDFGVETTPTAFAQSGQHPSSFNNSSPSQHKPDMCRDDLLSKDGKLRQDSSVKKRYIKDVEESSKSNTFRNLYSYIFESLRRTQSCR